ncbi:MAG: fluoride efflux transporter CrcB [Polyangia bacterium]|jgi:CrcB protein
MSKLLLVALGGALGTGARYLLSVWALTTLGPAFPYGTLAVNAIGSFLICAIMHLAVVANVITPTLRLFLTTGILGGFTTYSSFDYETFRYAQEGAYPTAALYVSLTLVLCFAAGIAGDGVAKLLVHG